MFEIKQEYRNQTDQTETSTRLDSVTLLKTLKIDKPREDKQNETRQAPEEHAVVMREALRLARAGSGERR